VLARPVNRPFGADSSPQQDHLELVLSAEARGRHELYPSGMVRNGLLSLWDEPPAPNPPIRVWRDWALVGALTLSALLEGLLRPDVTWRPVALLLCLALALTLLWRRTHPLAVIAVVFGAVTVIDFVAPYDPAAPFGLYSMAFILLLPYALGRWGSGRAVIIGLVLTLGTHILREAPHTNYGDLLIGIPFLLTPALLGLAVRWRTSSRTREFDQVRLREREELARELHDTVAHHVSAIAIQAQAGSVVAASRPDAAIEALRTIEAEATRALTEMREMVGALRDGQAADLVPQRGVADIWQLAGAAGESPLVAVDVTGDVGDLRPSVDAAVYRLAQESITNAVRHARHATRIDVRVVGEDDRVLLTVADDGDPTSAGRSSGGYGIVGMTERATMLGGTLEAGPRPDRGWTVTAELPRAAASR
jgi:glucose-6-phosphate-specific signal transduction histidine kinase